MSDPVLDYKCAVQGALSELTKAMSTLNTPPEPRATKGDNWKYDHGYLSEVDETAHHAYQHLNAAWDYIAKTQRQMEALIRAAEMLLEIQFNVFEPPEIIYPNGPSGATDVDGEIDWLITTLRRVAKEGG